MLKLIQNAVYIPEDDVYLVSTHVHDFRNHTFKDGLHYAVDGGTEYSRYVADLGTEARVVDFRLYDSDDYNKINDMLLWGNRGKKGDQPLVFRPIKELATDHLEAIVDNCPYASPIAFKVIHHWLRKRELYEAKRVQRG